MIRRKIPWTSQPQYPVGLDRTNPYARYFSAFLYPIGGTFHDACQGELHTGTPTSVSSSVSSVGKVLQFDGSTSKINYGDVSLVDFTSGYSVFVLFCPEMQTGTRREMLVAKDNAAGRQFTVELNPYASSGSSDGQLRSIGHTRFVTNTTYYQKYTAANTVTNGQWYSLLLGSTDGSTDIIGFLNGSSLSLVNGSGLATGAIQNTTTPLIIGARDYVGYEDYFGGKIAVVAILKTPPSLNLAQNLYQNPWQFLAPQERKIFVSVAGGGLNITTILATADASGFTANVDRQLAITASLGTATASGFTANIDRQLAISATLATASADAFSANADRQLSIIATLATATASGFTANVSSDLNVTTTLATATASGFSANVDRQLSIVTILATATASGFDASIALGGGLNITATHAVATASGFDASITISTPQGSGWETYVAPIRKKTVKQFKEEFNDLTYFELEEKEDEVKSEIRLVEQDIRLNEDLGLDNLILKLKLALKIQKAKLQAIKSVKQEKIQEAQVQQIQHEAIPIEYTQDIDIIHEDENIDADLSYIAAILRMKYFN